MLKVVCIGAGRLAQHLMPAFQNSGCEIVQVYNRTTDAAARLAKKLNIPSYTNQLNEIAKDADLYVLAVADDAVENVSKQLQAIHDFHGIVVHSSGVLGLDVIPFARRGIFYPLQTFSGHHDVEWKKIPIIIISENAGVTEILKRLAASVSDTVHEMTPRQKRIAHLAAVFANNFTNHILTLAEKLCEENGVPFSILHPLIELTVEKAVEHGPVHSQTGPAKRGDDNTIQKHLELLGENPDMVEIYKVLTKSIDKNSSGKSSIEKR